MEAKYNEYKRYSWQDDQDWQVYLSNLYPTPVMKVLEKIRRKWYKKNKVTDFDIDYTPPDPSYP